MNSSFIHAAIQDTGLRRRLHLPAEPGARAGDLRRHLPARGAGDHLGSQRLLRLLQVPLHTFGDQADRRHRLCRRLVVSDCRSLVSPHSRYICTQLYHLCETVRFCEQDCGGDRVGAVHSRSVVERQRGAGGRAVLPLPQGRHLRRRRRAHPRRHGARHHLLHHAAEAAGGGGGGGDAGSVRRRHNTEQARRAVAVERGRDGPPAATTTE